jgi:hypothetical protein
MPLNALALPLSYAFSSIFANKLLISVRCAYYSGAPGTEFEADYPAIQFNSNPVTSGSSTDVKSEKFDEAFGV